MKLYLCALAGLLCATACTKNETAVDQPGEVANETEIRAATPDRPASDTAPAADAREVDLDDDKPKAADNTANNKGDGSGTAVTPLDQKENQSDFEITQKIRQAVMATDSLSFNAKNAKIITQNGKVTLRGAVENAQERSTIEGLARRVAGTVDNQLEVKSK